MKRYFSFLVVIALFLGLFFPVIIFAQNPSEPGGGYELLVEDLPFIKDVPKEAGLAGYLKAFFQLGLGIAVLLSVLLFVFNGVVYMTSDVIGKKGDAKHGMLSAILGLVLAFSSWLILRTINLSLVDFQLFKTLAEIREDLSTPPPAPPETTPPSGEEEAMRQMLKTIGVAINNPPCAGASGDGCTNVAGLQSTITHLAQLSSFFGGCTDERWEQGDCPITITGGTEGAGTTHQTHGVGKPIFDLRHSTQLTSIIKSPAYSISCAGGASYNNLGPVWVKRDSYIYYMEEAAGGLHWHVCMGQSYCPSLSQFCRSAQGQGQ